MKTVAEKLKELREREAAVLGLGGKSAVEKQHAGGKLTARERLDLLFDPGTFQEPDMFVTHRCVNFGMEKVEIPADGVITGFGQVNGRPVLRLFAGLHRPGGLPGRDARQEDLQGHGPGPEGRRAVRRPQRLRRGPDPGRRGFAVRLRPDLFPERLACGVIPQISAIMGPTAGGAVYSPAMTDFIFMVKNTSYMFITGPDVIKSVTGEEITFEDLGGAMAHNAKSGVAHFACETDADCIAQIRRLLSFLPGQQHGGSAPRPWRSGPPRGAGPGLPSSPTVPTRPTTCTT